MIGGVLQAVHPEARTPQEQLRRLFRTAIPGGRRRKLEGKDARASDERKDAGRDTVSRVLRRGLARESWELPVYQYADVEVALSFSSWVDLGQIITGDF